MIDIGYEEVHGMATAIRGMRNPLNSWDKCDSGYLNGFDFRVGEKDLELMKKLTNAGTDHRKFLRMITVSCDILAPLYWWKQFDTYKIGTVTNSCSTMHKIAEKEFVLNDFSCEYLFDGIEKGTEFLKDFMYTINALNKAREKYLETKKKIYWWQIIQILPSSYNQKRTVLLNYEVLLNMYHSRKNHKLDEWRTFCEWVERLPYMGVFLNA